jgi:PAS domain S-box-containing protein
LNDRLERPRLDVAVDVGGLIQETLLGEALAHADYVALVADEDMRFVAVSDAACELLGWTREALLERSVPDIVVDRREATDRYGRFIREGVQRGVITLRRSDASTFEADYEARRTALAGGTVYVSVLIPHTD